MSRISFLMRAGRRFSMLMGLELFWAAALFVVGADVKLAGADEKPVVLPQMIVVDSRVDPKLRARVYSETDATICRRRLVLKGR